MGKFKQAEVLASDKREENINRARGRLDYTPG
jgi:hypothetical protein